MKADKLYVRVSPEMHREVRDWAAREDRSWSAFVRLLIREGLNRRKEAAT